MEPFFESFPNLSCGCVDIIEAKRESPPQKIEPPYFLNVFANEGVKERAFLLFMRRQGEHVVFYFWGVQVDARLF